MVRVRVRGEGEERGEFGGWWVAAVKGVLLVGAFLFPYSKFSHEQVAPFGFPLATGVIVLGLGWKGAGLPRGWRAWLGSVVIAAVLVVVVRAVMGATVLADGALELAAWPWVARASFVFQTLNEEIVLGYVPLMLLRRRCGRVATVVVLAAVFSALHVALYGFGGHRIWLGGWTVMTLLVVGVLRNGLILWAGHVGWAWALHAAWNLLMFAGTWTIVAERRELPEPIVLEVFLGHPVVFGVALLGAGGVLWRLAVASRR